MKSRRLQFTGSVGYKLSGLLELPDEAEPVAFAILAHCFTCNKNYKILAHISQALTQHGIAALRFDFTGLGASQGSFADTNFSSNVGDLVAAANFLELNYGAPLLFIGHSFGGAAAIHAAAQVQSCRAVVTIATPSSLDDIRQLLLTKETELRQKGAALFQISGRQFKIKKQFLDDIEGHDLKTTLANLNKPYLIIHAVGDTIVPIDNALRLFNLANYPKNFICLDQAVHLVSDEREAKYLGQLIAVWASKYLQ